MFIQVSLIPLAGDTGWTATVTSVDGCYVSWVIDRNTTSSFGSFLTLPLYPSLLTRMVAGTDILQCTPADDSTAITR